MSQVFNLFLHHHDGGSGASNYKDIRGGTRCAVTDSQFTDWRSRNQSFILRLLNARLSKLKQFIGCFD